MKPDDEPLMNLKSRGHIFSECKSKSNFGIGDDAEPLVRTRVSWFVRRKTTLKHTGDLPGNNGSKQSLHRFQKKMQESTRKRSESLTLEKRNISFYFHSSRTKKTSVAPAPMLEIHSRAHTNYNGVKTDPCNLNGIGVASRHRITVQESSQG